MTPLGECPTRVASSRAVGRYTRKKENDNPPCLPTRFSHPQIQYASGPTLRAGRMSSSCTQCPRTAGLLVRTNRTPDFMTKLDRNTTLTMADDRHRAQGAGSNLPTRVNEIPPVS
ncbi:hypothetical protein NW759_009497 [Fusarium solani]|nr:hypothetical protein NW759_009497 [Fusarium solani]